MLGRRAQLCAWGLIVAGGVREACSHERLRPDSDRELWISGALEAGHSWRFRQDFVRDCAHWPDTSFDCAHLE